MIAWRKACCKSQWTFKPLSWTVDLGINELYRSKFSCLRPCKCFLFLFNNLRLWFILWNLSSSSCWRWNFPFCIWLTGCSDGGHLPIGLLCLVKVISNHSFFLFFNSLLLDCFRLVNEREIATNKILVAYFGILCLPKFIIVYLLPKLFSLITIGKQNDISNGIFNILCFIPNRHKVIWTFRLQLIFVDFHPVIDVDELITNFNQVRVAFLHVR